MRCVKSEVVQSNSDLYDLEIEGGDGNYVVEGIVAHNSNFRVGFHGTRPFMVGTHTSRVVDSRLDPASWPEGHLIRKALEWCVAEGLEGRLKTFRANHPEITSLAIYGEICGFKCSDLHYGRTSETEVLLFGEVAVNSTFLSYDAAMAVIGELFPGRTDLVLPVLYRGKPDADVFKRLRDQASALAASRGVVQISEGVVIRPTTEVIVRTGRLTCKYKSPLYEERKSLRSGDPGNLPVYVSAYDLLCDFVTEERIRHVVAKARGSGMVLTPKSTRTLSDLIYADIRKESVGEWPEGSEHLSEDTLRNWVGKLAGEMIQGVISE